MKLSRILIAISAIAGTTAMTGCMDRNGSLRNPRGNGGSNSVVAAIEGIAESDLGREGMKYTLVCGADLSIVGSPNDDKSSVVFSGDKITDTMICSLEIGISELEANKLAWNWFGINSKKEAIHGLMYGSDKKEIGTSRKPLLTLYRLYSPKPPISFVAALNVSLDVADAAAMPAEDVAKASLICGTDSYPGDYKKQDGKNAQLTFELDIKEFANKKCSDAAVTINNVAAFTGATTGVVFTSPEKDKTLSFPKEGEPRFVLSPIKVVGGNVDVSTNPGGICLKYQDSVCLDRSVQDLGKATKNYIVAKVKGRYEDGLGDVVTLYVGAGASGFGLFEGSKLDVKAINKAARAAAGSADRKEFSFYKSKISDDLEKAPFDADFVSGKAFESSVAEESDLAGILLLHIESVRLHGMHAVEAKDLNQAENAHWLAVVKAKKDAVEKEFIATGVDKYFYSPAAPLTIDDKPVYMNMNAMLVDMAAAGGPDKYRAYAVKDGIMAPAACKSETSFYLAGMSARHLGNLKPASGVDADLDACDIEPAKFSAAVGSGYTFSATLYKFGWLELTK